MKFRKILSLFLTFAMFFLVLMFAVSCSSEIIDVPDGMKVIVYVTAGASEEGADGSKEHPYATLEAARDAVRSVDRTDELTGIDVIVSGKFFLSTAVVMTEPADSGTPQCPISWIGAEEGAHITGGIEMNAADFAPVSSDDPFYRRFDSSVCDRIVSFDMKTLGVTPENVVCGERSYSPNGANAVVYSGNRRLTVARYPDDEYAFIRSYEPDENNDYVFGYDAVHNEHIKNWVSLDDIFVNGYFKFFWAQDRTKLISFDTDNSIMKIMNSDGYVPNEGMVFYWFNIPEELTQTGEYYISPDAVLYAILPENAETLSYPIANTGFFNVKADYITFDNITFSDSIYTMAIFNGNHVTVKNCLFERGGDAAVDMNGNDNRFENNEIGHFAFGGISVKGGQADTLTDSNSIVYNNYIHDFSEELSTYCPAVDIRGCGITVAHNEIAHSNHDALSWQGHNHIVEYNEFYDICNNTDDAGVCYAGRTLDWYGNIFRYNYMHEIGSDTLMQNFGGGCGGHGIYYDDGLGGQIAYGNIFENFWFGFAFAIGGGSDHIVEGNLFINCDTAIGYDERYYALYRETGEFSHKLLDNVYDKYLNSEVLSKAFPTITQMNSNGDLNDPWFWVSPARSSIKNNVAFCTNENAAKQYSLADSVYLFSEFENNTVKRYAEGRQPTVAEALEESWLEIPLEEIGRIK